MLKERIITGLILLIGLGACIFYFSHFAFAIAIIVIFSIGAWEWVNLSGFECKTRRLVFSAVFAAILAALFAYLGLLSSNSALIDHQGIRDVAGVGCTWWALALLWVKTYPSSAGLWGHKLSRLVMGLVVLVPSAVALAYLHQLRDGHWLILYMILVVSGADVGAYFAGRKWGKAKLAPSVSPGKSWAGVWGGLSFVALASLLVGLNYNVAGLSLVALVIVSVITAMASVLGDLVESMVKRHRGIKDSSQLLPGHGGVLDRMDSMTAAAPVFVLFVILLSV